MLNDAGFANIQIQVKENAADIIKDWMPGSGAEKYVTSAYVTAIKRAGRSVHDDVRRNAASLWNWKSANLLDRVPEVKEGLPGDPHGGRLEVHRPLGTWHLHPLDQLVLTISYMDGVEVS